MRACVVRTIAILAAVLALEGCATTNQAINVSVSQMRPFAASRGPGCDMPVLTERPTRHFVELAIVEGWAGSKDQEQELLQKLKNRACETGADALLINYSKEQQENRQNSIQVADRVADEASRTADETVDQQRQDTYHAIWRGSGMLGTPGHGGYYMDTYAIKFTSDGDHP
jgi:hypothetical protein